MNFDLHTHTTFSDGSFTPEDLIDLALKIGLKGLAITDHDSILAYPSALILAKSKGLQLIPGVEFSCHYKNTSVHILGYSFKCTEPGLLEFCERHKNRRNNRNRKILEKLKDHGVEISEAELKNSASGMVGRPHIAKILVEQGHAPDIASAFKLFLGDGKKCYVSGELFTIEETLNVIHSAGGLAVLAHPHLYYDSPLVKEILSHHPFDGLECEYGKMPPEKNAPWITYATKHGLIMTGGSDFHGTIKPNLPLGATTITQEQAAPLLTRFYDNHSEHAL